MCGISLLVKIVDLFALTLLVIFTGVYLWPSFSNFKFTTELGVIAPWCSLAGSLVAIFFTLMVTFCSGNTMECGIILVILAVVNIAAYVVWGVKGNPNSICDGASELAGKAGAADMVNCGASWVKYVIYALLVIAGLSQLAVAAVAVGCSALRGGGGTQSLGKRAAAAGTSMKSLGRRVRSTGERKHRWGRIADEEHDLAGQTDYPLRSRAGNEAGLSDTTLGDSSDGEGEEWKERRTRRIARE
ncbi:hypothetical protein JCM10908_007224 [Rhodotorula pacifica]|uniref:uncharacterized protein n=1 Tax=Rhodotorula pacifica TaxID=1495444 RepID=UPI00316AFB70